VEIAAVGGTFPVWTPDSRHVVFSSDSGLWSVEVKDGKAVAQPELLRSDIRGVVPIGVRAGSYYYIDQPPAVDVIAIAAMERGGVRIEGKALTITKKILGIYPSWSPDGRRIAFRRRQSGGGDPLLVIHTIETGEERVYRRPGMKTAPGWWFHDGNSFLLSARREDGQQCLYRLDLRTGEFKDILTFGDEFLGTDYPIALDDRRIYLAGRSTDTPLGLFNRVVAVDVGTGQRQQVFSLPRSGSIMGVHLSPDGRSLLLSIEDGAARTKHLARVSVDGTEYRELVNGAAGFYIGVAWAPDSRGVLFSRRVGNSNDWQVMRIPAEGGTPVFTGLAARDQERLLIKLNHDGSRLAFSSTETVRELWALDNLLPNLK
jgi:Tol biopolymer transport system component